MINRNVSLRVVKAQSLRHEQVPHVLIQETEGPGASVSLVTRWSPQASSLPKGLPLSMIV